MAVMLVFEILLPPLNSIISANTTGDVARISNIDVYERDTARVSADIDRQELANNTSDDINLNISFENMDSDGIYIVLQRSLDIVEEEQSELFIDRYKIERQEGSFDDEFGAMYHVFKLQLRDDTKSRVYGDGLESTFDDSDGSRDEKDIDYGHEIIEEDTGRENIHVKINKVSKVSKGDLLAVINSNYISLVESQKSYEKDIRNETIVRKKTNTLIDSKFGLNKGEDVLMSSGARSGSMKLEDIGSGMKLSEEMVVGDTRSVAMARSVNLSVTVKVFEKGSEPKKPIKGAVIQVRDGVNYKNVTTGEDGVAHITGLENTGKLTILQVSTADGYLCLQDEKTYKIDHNMTNVVAEIENTKDPLPGRNTIVAKAIDEKTGRGVSDVKFKLEGGGRVYYGVTGPEGSFSFKGLDKGTRYSLTREEAPLPYITGEEGRITVPNLIVNDDIREVTIKLRVAELLDTIIHNHEEGDLETPIVGSRFRLYYPNGQSREFTTNSNGNLEFKNINADENMKGLARGDYYIQQLSSDADHVFTPGEKIHFWVNREVTVNIPNRLKDPTSAKVSLNYSKEWVDKPKTKMVSKIYLYADGVKDEKNYFEASSDQKTVGKFENLPKYTNDHKQINYTLKEDTINGYHATYSYYYDKSKDSVTAEVKNFEGNLEGECSDGYLWVSSENSFFKVTVPDSGKGVFPKGQANSSYNFKVSKGENTFGYSIAYYKDSVSGNEYMLGMSKRNYLQIYDLHTGQSRVIWLGHLGAPHTPNMASYIGNTLSVSNDNKWLIAKNLSGDGLYLFDIQTVLSTADEGSFYDNDYPRAKNDGKLVFIYSPFKTDGDVIQYENGDILFTSYNEKTKRHSFLLHRYLGNMSWGPALDVGSLENGDRLNNTVSTTGAGTYVVSGTGVVEGMAYVNGRLFVSGNVNRRYPSINAVYEVDNLPTRYTDADTVIRVKTDPDYTSILGQVGNNIGSANTFGTDDVGRAIAKSNNIFSLLSIQYTSNDSQNGLSIATIADMAQTSGDDCKAFIDVHGAKTWMGDKDSDRPETISVELMRQTENGKNGQDIIWSESVVVAEKTTSSKENWEYKFERQPTRDSKGKRYKYSIREKYTPDGYYSTSDGLNITNTLRTKARVEIVKTDTNKQNPKKLKDAEFTLYSDQNCNNPVVTDIDGNLILAQDRVFSDRSLLDRISNVVFGVDENQENVVVDGGTRSGVEITRSNPDISHSGLASGDGRSAIKNTYTVKSGYDGRVIFENLVAGTYYIKETKAPMGYKPNEKPYKLVVNFDDKNNTYSYSLKDLNGLEVDKFENTYKIENEEADYELRFIKTDDAKKNPMPLGGAKFELLEGDNKVQTGRVAESKPDGSFSFQALKPDVKYYLRELSAPQGYVKIKGILGPYSPTKIGDTSVQSYKIENTKARGKFIIRKKGPEGEDLPEALFELNGGDLPRAQKKKSDSKGRVIYDNLNPGKYVLREIEAPDGYIANTSKIWTIDVGQDGKTTIKVSLESDTNSTRDLDMSNSYESDVTMRNRRSRRSVIETRNAKTGSDLVYNESDGIKKSNGLKLIQKISPVQGSQGYYKVDVRVEDDETLAGDAINNTPQTDYVVVLEDTDYMNGSEDFYKDRIIYDFIWQLKEKQPNARIAVVNSYLYDSKKKSGEPKPEVVLEFTPVGNAENVIRNMPAGRFMKRQASRNRSRDFNGGLSLARQLLNSSSADEKTVVQLLSTTMGRIESGFIANYISGNLNYFKDNGIDFWASAEIPSANDINKYYGPFNHHVMTLADKSEQINSESSARYRKIFDSALWPNNHSKSYLNIKLNDNVVFDRLDGNIEANNSDKVKYDADKRSITAGGISLSKGDVLKFSYYVRANSEKNNVALNKKLGIADEYIYVQNVDKTSTSTSMFPSVCIEIPGINIKAKKEWDDNIEQSSKMDTRIILNRNSRQVGQVDNFGLTDSNVDFGYYPQYNNQGVDYRYTVEEKDLNKKMFITGVTYKKDSVNNYNIDAGEAISGDKDGLAILKTSYGKLSLKVRKTWNDATDNLKKTVKVGLIAYIDDKKVDLPDGVDKVKELTNPGWTAVFDNLPMADSNGKLYTYRVEELGIDGMDLVDYDIEYIYNSNEDQEIVNTKIPEVEVVNMRKTEYPYTGGFGSLPYCVVGGALMLMSYMSIRRRYN